MPTARRRRRAPDRLRPLKGGPDHSPDHVLVGHPTEIARQTEVRDSRALPGQRVHLEKLEPPGRVAAQIHAAHVTAPEPPPRRESQRLRLGLHAAVHQLVANPAHPIYLYVVGVNGARQVLQRLEYAYNFGPGAGSENRYGQLAAWQVRLNQRRLTEAPDRLRTGRTERGTVAHP